MRPWGLLRRRNMQTSDKRDPLAHDLIVQAAALLGDGGEDLVLGVELDFDPRIAILDDDLDRTRWRPLSCHPPVGNYAGLVRAARALSGSWLGSLPETVVRNIGLALYRGGRLRLYVRPRRGDIDLALWFNGDLVDVARYAGGDPHTAADQRRNSVGSRDPAA
jgi:hypothetical protein